MKKILLFASLALAGVSQSFGQNTIWQIGKADGSANEFALAPGGFKKFLEHDFGFEDKFYLIGHSKVDHDFPYVLAGPADTWGGTWPTSGWRTNQVNILFSLKENH